MTGLPPAPNRSLIQDAPPSLVYAADLDQYGTRRSNQTSAFTNGNSFGSLLLVRSRSERSSREGRGVDDGGVAFESLSSRDDGTVEHTASVVCGYLSVSNARNRSTRGLTDLTGVLKDSTVSVSSPECGERVLTRVRGASAGPTSVQVYQVVGSACHSSPPVIEAYRKVLGNGCSHRDVSPLDVLGMVLVPYVDVPVVADEDAHLY